MLHAANLTKYNRAVTNIIELNAISESIRNVGHSYISFV